MVLRVCKGSRPPKNDSLSEFPLNYTPESAKDELMENISDILVSSVFEKYVETK